MTGRSGSGGASASQLLGQPAGLLAVEQQVEVAAADPAGEDLRQHLPGSRHGLGELVDPKFPVLHHHGAHRPSVGRGAFND